MTEQFSFISKDKVASARLDMDRHTNLGTFHINEQRRLRRARVYHTVSPEPSLLAYTLCKWRKARTKSVRYVSMGYCTNSKTGVNGHSQKYQKMVFKTDDRLMQFKSIAECSKGSILQYFRPSLSYQLSLRPCLSILHKFYCNYAMLVSTKMSVVCSSKHILTLKPRHMDVDATSLRPIAVHTTLF